jgi:Tol biopolymer transport system component
MILKNTMKSKKMHRAKFYTGINQYLRYKEPAMLPTLLRIVFYFGTALLLCLLNNDSFAGQTTRVSVASSGKQGNASSFFSSISADGRYVIFRSVADNLVVGNTSIFVHDRLTHKNEGVSAQTRGYPTISANNRYVVFLSIDESVVVYDRLTHKNEIIGSQYRYTENFAISADGRFVAFVSRKEDGSHHLANAGDVFVHDRLNHKTTQVDDTVNGFIGDNLSSHPSLSADGRYVTFDSTNSNLVKGDSNGVMDVFAHDRRTHKTELVSIASNGKQANSSSSRPIFSVDGRYVAFISYANNLVVGDINNTGDIFVYDRHTHKTERIIESPKDLYELNYAFSADARFVAFNIRTSIDNGTTVKGNDIFIHDRMTHKNTKINVASNNVSGNGQSSAPSLSADGRYVAFSSDASNLVAGDTNKVTDIFVRDRLLDITHHADLKITPTQKPATLKPNTQSTYLYTITNNGKDTVADVSLLHLLSGGVLTKFKPSQGSCITSPVESVCHLGKLAAGKKLMLSVVVKAQNKAFSQQVSVSGAPVDAVPANNQVLVTTLVK